MNQINDSKISSDDSTITYMQAVRKGADMLRCNNIDNAEYDSFALFEDVTGISRTQYLIHGNDIIDKDIYKKYLANVEKRAKHIPLQHILGKAYFYGYEYKVNENVLVPRPDTEVLVEQVLKVTDKDSDVLDMCTGSGCIILTIALEGHLKSGIGADISEKALEVAEQNRAANNVSEVTLIQSDLFSNIKASKYDVIVSNPPYIRSDVIQTLSEEVRLHDPMMALDGFEDGLFFYRKITEQAVNHIKSGGWLMYEIGHDQAEDVCNIMKQNGFSNISVVKDLAGLDRVVKGILL